VSTLSLNADATRRCTTATPAGAGVALETDPQQQIGEQ